MRIPEQTTLRHKIGTCPACRSYLWAEVHIATDVSAPTMTEGGKCVAYANAKAVGMNVEHHCGDQDEALLRTHCPVDHCEWWIETGSLAGNRHALYEHLRSREAH